MSSSTKQYKSYYSYDFGHSNKSITGFGSQNESQYPNYGNREYLNTRRTKYYRNSENVQSCDGQNYVAHQKENEYKNPNRQDYRSRDGPNNNNFLEAFRLNEITPLRYNSEYTPNVPNKYLKPNIILDDDFYLSGAITPNYENCIKTPTSLDNEVKTQPIINADNNTDNQCLSSIVVLYSNKNGTREFLDMHGCITESVKSSLQTDQAIGKEIIRALGEEFGSMYTCSETIDVLIGKVDDPKRDITTYTANINVSQLEHLTSETKKSDIKIPSINQIALPHPAPSQQRRKTWAQYKIVLYIQGARNELRNFLNNMSNKFKDNDDIYGYGIIDSNDLKLLLSDHLNVEGEILTFQKLKC
jgi:hypothetical protein